MHKTITTPSVARSLIPALSTDRSGLALSIGPSGSGFYMNTETESSLRNAVIKIKIEDDG
jgi:hypothetical protein